VKPRHLTWLRRTSQGFFLLLFLFLLVQARLSQDVYVDYSAAVGGEQDLRLGEPVDFFFRIDPLIWLTSLLSDRRWIAGFWWAVGIVAGTVLLGRFFCGFVCPLGTMHHLASWLRPALKGGRMIRANRKGPGQRVKYFVLIACLAAAALGLNLAGLMDPLSFAFRSVALAVVPGIGVGLRGIFDAMARSDIKILNLMSYGGEVLVSPIFGYEDRGYQTAWFIGLLFLVVLFMNRIRPRFWCRSLCPLGALLGICSRFSVLKLEKDASRCTNCQMCTGACQGGAGPQPGEAWEKSECLLCFNCFETCRQGALSFRFALPGIRSKGPDMGRRAVLGGLVAGLSLPLLAPLDSRMLGVADSRLIRPPGALPEARFLALCQRCGLCMKVCPTNVLHPTLGEAGMAGFWTPHCIMTRGYCEYTCTLCGSVCPTGAIEKITAAEKTGRPVRIGSAYVDRGRCLPWAGNGPCIVCEEHCPTSPKAIYLHESQVQAPHGRTLRVQLPQVDLKRCVGCGICANKCPVRGRPAIRVIAAGETRSVINQILLGF